MALSPTNRVLLATERDVYSLEIVEVKYEDSGEYSAYITNAAGAAYSSARMVVLGGWACNFQEFHEISEHHPRLCLNLLGNDRVHNFFIPGPGDRIPETLKIKGVYEYKK